MKVFFSELVANPAYYSFGYSVYGELEPPDDLAECYEKGFLPFVGARLQSESGAPMMYMARGTRVRVNEFKEQHYHGRVIRKVESVIQGSIDEKIQVIEHLRETFPITDEFISFILSYFSFRFGKDSMPRERLLAILASPLLTHIVEYRVEGKPIAYMLEVHTSTCIQVWYQTYAKSHERSHLGSYLFIDLLRRAKKQNKDYVYLGVTYGNWMKYKTNFQPLEYWDGRSWVTDAKSKILKKLLATDSLRMLAFTDTWREKHEPFYKAPYPFASTFMELRFLTMLMTAAPRIFGMFILALLALMLLLCTHAFVHF
jgi:arginyl-tRNA--protein-N-Asp/Glu arginylyltransferase